MEELIKMIQQDPELWEIVENAKHPDQEPMEFFESVAAMLAIEFEELHRTDLKDKLAGLFGGLPKKGIPHGSLPFTYCFGYVPIKSKYG